MARQCIIIDDNKFDRLISKKIIEMSGLEFEVVEFVTGKEAFEHLAQYGKGLGRTVILLDLNMPEMSGYEFLEKLQATFPEKILAEWSVVIITSSTRQEDLDRCFAFPYVFDYVQKPFSQEKMDRVLEKI